MLVSVDPTFMLTRRGSVWADRCGFVPVVARAVEAFEGGRTDELLPYFSRYGMYSRPWGVPLGLSRAYKPTPVHAPSNLSHVLAANGSQIASQLIQAIDSGTTIVGRRLGFIDEVLRYGGEVVVRGRGAFEKSWEPAVRAFGPDLSGALYRRVRFLVSRERDSGRLVMCDKGPSSYY